LPWRVQGRQWCSRPGTARLSSRSRSQPLHCRALSTGDRPDPHWRVRTRACACRSKASPARRAARRSLPFVHRRGPQAQRLPTQDGPCAVHQHRTDPAARSKTGQALRRAPGMLPYRARSSARRTSSTRAASQRRPPSPASPSSTASASRPMYRRSVCAARRTQSARAPRLWGSAVLRRSLDVGTLQRPASQPSGAPGACRCASAPATRAAPGAHRPARRPPARAAALPALRRRSGGSPAGPAATGPRSAAEPGCPSRGGGRRPAPGRAPAHARHAHTRTGRPRARRRARSRRPRPPRPRRAPPPRPPPGTPAANRGRAPARPGSAPARQRSARAARPPPRPLRAVPQPATLLTCTPLACSSRAWAATQRTAGVHRHARRRREGDSRPRRAHGAALGRTRVAGRACSQSDQRTRQVDGGLQVCGQGRLRGGLGAAHVQHHVRQRLRLDLRLSPPRCGSAACDSAA